MASIFGHALTAYAIQKVASVKVNTTKLSILTIFCAIIPDADVIMFNFGYSYEHPLGHRGFTHSILFAILLALLIRFAFYSKIKCFSKTGISLFIVFFLATISHGLLDAVTTGGRGVGFFIPFDNMRYFFPWRFITVSPLGATRFFSEWGLRVLQNEFVYIGIPCISILLMRFIWQKHKRNTSNHV